MSRPAPSTTHLVVIPSYNTGALVLQTAKAALAVWQPVWVVVDGSTDGSGEMLHELGANEEHLRVIELEKNSGKGAAVLAGARAALTEGFTHILTMDADGQHPPERIEQFMAESKDAPGALVLGKPEFGQDAPALRVHGRKISNFWAKLETLWAGIGDSLFGMRVYPIAELVAVMSRIRFARRFDFDPEAAVRLCWKGLTIRNLDCPVRYLSESEGGVSQFRYLRDNALLTWMHLRLLTGFIFRLPFLALGRCGIGKKR